MAIVRLTVDGDTLYVSGAIINEDASIEYGPAAVDANTVVPVIVRSNPYGPVTRTEPFDPPGTPVSDTTSVPLTAAYATVAGAAVIDGDTVIC